VSPTDVFEAAFEHYEELRETIGATPGVTFHDSQGGGQGIVGMPPVEFCADFELVAARALRKWPARVEFFRLHFLCGVEDVAKVSEALKLEVNTGWKWKWMLQRCVGNELRKCGKIARKSGVFYFTRHVRKEETRW
jgi:hypothetical protein